MNLLRPLLDNRVELEISGMKAPVQGRVVDIGQDILVLYNETKYMYIPILHLQKVRTVEDYDENQQEPAERPFDHADIAYRKILMNARGIFTELFISGNASIHGYITSIMNDFFVFFSPVYRSVFVSMNHVKMLTPYAPNRTPYFLSQDRFPLQPASVTLTRTFEQQMKKLEGELVVLNLGEQSDHIGRLHALQDNMAELITAHGQHICIHTNHVKTIHLP